MQPRSTVVLSIFLACACQPKDESPAAKAPAKTPAESKSPTPPEDEVETPTTAVHMQDHFAKAGEIKAALIKGDLEGAREPARWMAEHQHEVDHPEAWKPHIQGMRDAGEVIGSAADLAAATKGFVSMGEACAACHGAVGGPKPTVGTPPAEAEGSGTKQHMARHQWAVDQMWLGLFAPSREVWIAGAEALAEAPLLPEKLAPNQTLSPEVQALAARVHELGNKARDAPEASAIPGEIYGELLAGCETCHASLRPK